MPDLKAIFAQIDSLENEIVELERDLIGIPSVNTGTMPTGDETPVCEYIRDWLAEDGISSEIIGRVPERGNIIARIEGTSSDARLMFMSHTDVVPVEDEAKWTHPPFSATIVDGRIFGRGASDCKALLTAQLWAMRLLKRNGIKLKNSLILCSGADEEHGGRYGFGWLADNHPEKMAAPFAVNEGGGTPTDAAGSLTYLLGVGEKGRLQVEFEVKGVSAHASVPWQGANSLYRLSQLLQRIEAYEPERDTTTSLFEHLSTFAIEHKPSAENVDEIIEETQADNPRLASMLRALSRMTLTPTMINGGIKSNSVPESIHLTCDVRTLPHQNDDYLRQELDSIIEGVPGVSYEIDYMAVPNSSDFETELAEHIKAATALALERDDIRWVPAISTGFTDSRFTRPLNTVTYGFSGSHPDDDPMLSRAHGTDESVGIKSLISGTKIMLALACSLCGTE
ncbi:MAG: M20/M25/M40 family metallo-hydrolase [SAR202 cluster bacterium]|nr:M20/M25/M40 family metallo-hydrolase [SAR202 cluster bacterium]MDP6301601.1 M20/M25/M40 family metallo-hydrolase [SAR202 cluster bacterium]MDP7225075.1 M20/M25/M40 family metallo-hydrolase [SAR202 cluster bacterium]HJO82014.1 M20/M25/M40 family metallo-hydrolase [SAR202 cluster bacterium]